MNSTRAILRILVISTICLLHSCIYDPEVVTPGPGEGETEVVFSLQLPGSSGVTRGLALEGNEETYIDKIDVLLFEPNGGAFIYSRQGYNLDSNIGSQTRTFTVRLIPGTYDIVILANSREAIASSFPSGILTGTSREVVEAQLKLTVADEWETNTLDAAYLHIPMFGEKPNTVIDVNTNLTGSNGIDIIRMVSRVDVSVLPAAQTDFKLQEVYVYNRNTAGLVMPGTGNWNTGTSIATKPSIPQVSGSDMTLTKGPLEYKGNADASKSVEYTGDIYIFEAKAGSTDAYLNNTCLVVGGLYGGKMNYYRIDFIGKDSNDDDYYMDILRNHRYMVEVQRVSGEGYGTAEDAYKSLPINITAKVVKWNEKSLANVWDDGQYYISLSETEYNLSSMAGTEVLQLLTDFPNWKYKLSDKPDPDAATGGTESWVTITSGHAQNTEYTTSSDELKFSFSANITDPLVPRTAYIHIYAGRFKITVTLTQGVTYINGVSVTPTTRQLNGVGQTYTVTVNGLFDKVPVRVTNITSGLTLDATDVQGVTNNGYTTATYTYTIDQYWEQHDASRQFLIEYQDVGTGVWHSVIDPYQQAYWVKFAINDTADVTEFYGWGGYLNYTVHGNYPDLSVRLHGIPLSEQGSSNEEARTTYEYTAKMPAYSSSALRGYRLHIPYNPGFKREVYVEYKYNDVVGWVTVNDPDIVVKQRSGNKVLIDNYGEWSKGLNMNTMTWIRNVLTGSSGSDRPASNRNNSTEVVQFSTPAPNVPEGRIVAYMDYDQFAGAAAASQTPKTNYWYDAMGVDWPCTEAQESLYFGLDAPNVNHNPVQGTSWNTSRFLNYNYTITRKVGCGAYFEGSEDDPVTGAGQWRVPTHFEAIEIARYQAMGKYEHELGYIFGKGVEWNGRGTIYLWTSTEMHNQWNSSIYDPYQITAPGNANNGFYNDYLYFGPWRSTIIVRANSGPTATWTSGVKGGDKWTDKNNNLWTGLSYPLDPYNYVETGFNRKVLGNFTGGQNDKMATRCVRNKSTQESGGPGFTPISPW